MKFLVYAVLFFFAYRLFIKPLLIDGGRKRQEPLPRQEPDDDGFVEYEEVE